MTVHESHRLHKSLDNDTKSEVKSVAMTMNRRNKQSQFMQNIINGEKNVG